MSRQHTRKAWLLLPALVCAVAAGFVSLRNIDDQLAVMEACEAVDAGAWSLALERTLGRTDSSDTGRAATECRCLALLATGDDDACVELLEHAVEAGREDGWAPRPDLAIHLIQTWRAQARAEAAAELAQRAARLHPNDPDLFYLELETRAGLEGEDVVLRELEARVPERGPEAVRMRASLANRQLFRGDPERAIAALGDDPPENAGALVGLWYDTRGLALASSGDAHATIANYDAWRDAGGDAIEVAARYALAMSIAGLADPEVPPSEMLRRVLATADRFQDPALHEALSIRLILTLANEGNIAEALEVYDRAHARFELAGLSRAELERSDAHRRLADGPAHARRGRLEFVAPADAPGGSLLVSPQPDAAVDTRFESLPFPESGRLVVERMLGTAPVRWVYRDSAGLTRASGTANPEPGRRTRIDIAARTATANTVAKLERRPADGRRRVFLLLIDCGDWRIIEYLRARGELATLDGLLASGHRAVLHSDPPLTAAALEALVWPNRRNAASFVGLMHQMGTELAGLAAVGENPFEGLQWFLPEEPDLFSVLGADRHRVANLLLAHGSIRAGRHSEVTGPHGRKRRIPIANTARDLRADERERFPRLAEAATTGRDAFHIRTIAAEFDTAEQIAEAGEIDLLALRIEPFDILTHALFAETVRNGQDDGAHLLYDVYRYADTRIADVHAQIDEDDVLIVMSDHGIRTAMEHSKHGFFVATGAGISHGRSRGRPELRGVSAVLANLLDVETDWPQTGIAAWPADRAPAIDRGRVTENANRGADDDGAGRIPAGAADGERADPLPDVANTATEAEPPASPALP